MQIEEIFNDERFFKYCYSVTKNKELAKDLHQMIAIRFYEKNIKITGVELLKYFKVSALWEWKHPSSKFNQLYRRKPEKAFRSMITTESSDLEKFLNVFLCREIEDDEERFHNGIFLLYLSLGSTRKVSFETEINYVTVSKSVKYYSEKIKIEYEKYRNN